jgi:hypothetical protein
LITLLLLTGCAQADGGPPRIEFSQAASAPAYRGTGGPRGAAFSNGLEVFGPAAVRITALRPIADEGLRVRYLGVCYPGCPGAVGLEEGIRTVRRNLIATLPIDLVPGSRWVKLAFGLQPVGAIGKQALQTDCLRFRALEVTLEDGTTQVVHFCCGPYINALRPRDGQSECPPGDFSA